MADRSEFTVERAYRYDRRGVARWLGSHIWRYRLFAAVALGGYAAAWVSFACAQVLIGQTVQGILARFDPAQLLAGALAILGLLIADGAAFLVAAFAAENIAARVEADAREELYAGLLAKSQAFHDRQRVGDLIARATDDAGHLSGMIVPGATLLYETALGLTLPLLFIGGIQADLLLVPLLFLAAYVLAVRSYMRQLNPLLAAQRREHGALSAGLEETLSGIEAVKAAAREPSERERLLSHARRYHDLCVQQGVVEARYLPLLLYGATAGLTFLHALLLHQQGRLAVADIIAVTGLVGMLRFPTSISLAAFGLIQLGLASAGRILELISASTDLDENAGGVAQTIGGALVFEGVSFSYHSRAPQGAGTPALRQISFAARPGQTVAIIGQTGAGKTTLTRLINRTYDTDAGRVLIDGVDVRAWSLDSLRSQIAMIEQDVFLLSRTVAENIAFGTPEATHEQIVEAARAAQAHDFIAALDAGYQTVVGERGVMLSGGQRQRIALARALLRDPRILILDDSTSAVDSATEDAVQRAIRQARRGRTTVLITNRLAQIRWADLILVLDQGRLVASGTHDHLLRESPHYQRIFARYLHVDHTAAQWRDARA